jgi:hypothetical protein
MFLPEAARSETGRSQYSRIQPRLWAAPAAAAQNKAPSPDAGEGAVGPLTRRRRRRAARTPVGGYAAVRNYGPKSGSGIPTTACAMT